MARQVHRLSALAVARAKEPGMYADGAGLYLQVSSSGSKSWIFRYSLNHRPREMGLGSLFAISLSQARQKAQEARNLKASGIDPIAAKDAERVARAMEVAKQVTFADATDSYIRSQKAGWKNAKHGDQWKNTLQTYAFPVIGNLPVQDVDTGVIVKILEPIWGNKTETATRVRQRIESVLDWAKTRGHRTGENPARWRGHLDNVFPEAGKVKKVQHHPALPYSEIANFVKALKLQEGVASLALQFLILTAARTNEVTAAKWDEVDFDKKTWTIPAERIKAGREHCVPLSSPALSILKAIRKFSSGDFIFPGGKKEKPLSNGAFLALLKRMGRTDITAHGFRSTFRDWVSEETDYSRDVAEMALAHAISDKVEAAYRRGDLIEKRRKMMEEWGRYIGKPKSKHP